MKLHTVSPQPAFGAAAVSQLRPKSRGLRAPKGLTPPHRSTAQVATLVSLRMGCYDPRIHLGFIRAGRELGWNIHEIHEITQDFTTPWTLESGDCLMRLHPTDLVGDSDRGPHITLPFSAAGTLAADHLLALNFPNLAFFQRGANQVTGRLFRSFSKACAEKGRSVIELSGGLAGGLAAFHHTLEALKSLPLPCAVLAASDENAAALINAAVSLGIDVPNQLAVLGCGDQEIARAKCEPGLSSIDLNPELASYTMAKLFDRLLQGGEISETSWTVRPGGVIERESTRVNTMHPGIARVSCRIRTDYAESLTVPQLAREAGMSVRTLQRLYHEETGSAIFEDLLQIRLENASKLLVESDLKLEAIANMVGLGNANRLCRLFRARLGTTPNQCRTAAVPR